MSFVTPTYDATAFTCPFCNAIAAQTWREIYQSQYGSAIPFPDTSIKSSTCHHCQKFSIWLNQKMIFPDISMAPMPHEDMPDDCKNEYLEARSIVSRSPKGAAALLRLTVQKLLSHIGGEGKKIDSDIAKLVQQGLPIQVQQALDSCRVIGNNAVHPGELNVSDSPEIAVQMFELVNFIVDNRISQPKRIQAIYSALPQKSLSAIENRDKK